jgi:hypothetical protein
MKKVGIGTRVLLSGYPNTEIAEGTEKRGLYSVLNTNSTRGAACCAATRIAGLGEVEKIDWRQKQH